MSRSTFRAALWLACLIALMQALLPMRSQARVTDVSAAMLQEICSIGGVTIRSASNDDSEGQPRTASTCDLCPLCATTIPVPSSLPVQVLAAVPVRARAILPESTLAVASLAIVDPTTTGPPRQI
jgi:hypothetical protein